VCKLSEAKKHSVLGLIRGILFFGTPNQGMDISTLIPMVEGQPNEDFLRSLGRGSADLRRQEKQWKNAVDDPQSTVTRNLEIISYYETEESPTAIQVDGTWKMEGKPARLVDISSATHGRSWEEKNRYVQPIARNHSELVKFRRNDDVYSDRVRHDLKNFLKTNQGWF
jgi:protein SERAC1